MGFRFLRRIDPVYGMKAELYLLSTQDALAALREG